MSIIKARMISWDMIEVISSSFSNPPRFDLFVGDEVIFYNLNYNHSNKFIYKFNYQKEVLGKPFYIICDKKRIVVDVTEAINFDKFDFHYNYQDNDLGATYNRDYTKFVLWAPLATSVVLRVKGNEYDLKRTEHGVFRGIVDGDLDGELYDYKVTLNDKEIIVSDPYAKSVNTNSVKSAVINLAKLDMDMYDERLPKMSSYVEAIIYEASVRDMTISEQANIVNKGKFLGLTERGVTSKGGNPAGIDYIASLGVTHLQLLPVLDFASVDDMNKEQYNWGYDPLNFFALEGSYSTNPEDPYCRMKEFKKLVSTAHRLGLRVNLDVVYNHVYQLGLFSLNKITPNYFFRFENGKLANHSGCGNDFASERPMARKIILDSLKFLTETYDVDGFRFDLMGLIDLETISQAEKMLHSLKNDLMIYGEGWNMYPVSKFTKEFANMDNFHKLPRVAFFNDRYRNILKGIGDKSELNESGFLMGNPNFMEGFKFIFKAGTEKGIYPVLFDNYAQSLNFVECHDNSTLGDVILDTLTNEDDLAKYIKLFNKVLILSPGIVFIHMGQEFGQSKFGQSNTYNLGDYYNSFDYDEMDKHLLEVDSLRNYIKIRKSIPLYRLENPTEVNPNIEFENNETIIDITLRSNNVYHIMINIGDKHEILSEEKYDHYHLYGPYKSNAEELHIVLRELGLSAHKCSIFKES